MALTPFRWIALAAIGCMLAVLTVVSSAERALERYSTYRPRVPADTAEARLGEIAGIWNMRAQNLAARYRFRELIDSARRVAARTPDTGALRVFVGSEFDAKARVAIDNAIRGAQRERGGNAGGIDLFVLSDTLHFVRGIQRFGFLPEVHFELPEQAGDRCRVYVRTGYPQGRLGYSLARGDAEQQLLGPCGFYAAFGRPGPLVHEWLVQGAWQYTLNGSWTVAPAPLQYSRYTLDIYKGLSPALDQLDPRSGGPACMKGDLATCERIAATFYPSGSRMPVASPQTGITLGYPRYIRGGLGGLSVEMLSDAVLHLGRDRFRQFWTSPDPVRVAWEKASGESWGAFIRQWMISRYGNLDAGPRMSGFAMISSVILVLIAIGAMLRRAVTRTYV
jgi:hypothetical protein